ncbi:MAG TPA: hypothetical protein VFP98_06035, partial [Candidatus Polarisedimenticolia bacterium]|nr:hypothetical protein [Candidatus Polarisedimenticolia bacterium]
MRTERGKRLRWVTTAALMVWLGPVLPCLASAGAPRPLTFEQRVAAEQAIESVRYGHVVGAALPFDVAVPRTTLESRVRGTVRRSEALRSLWSRPITDAMLEAELARIIRRTRFPDRLGEIHAALGHDIFLLKETFVRSVLADRLSRAAFAYDRRIHAGTMQRAEIFRAQIGKRGGMAFADAPRPRIVQRVVSGARGSAPPGRAVVRELRDSFSVERARGPADAQGRVSFEIYDFPKRSWDGWWREVEASFPIETVPVASQSSTVAVPSPANGSIGCGSDDVWQAGALEDSPDPRYGHRAVWTGR